MLLPFAIHNSLLWLQREWRKLLETNTNMNHNLMAYWG